MLARLGQDAPTRPSPLEPSSEESDGSALMQDFAFDYASGVKAMDQEILEIIAQAFLDQWPEDIAKIQSGLKSGQAEPVLHTAHALKATLAMFGADPASELAARMEAMAREGALALIDSLVHPFVTEVDQLRAVLKRSLSAE